MMSYITFLFSLFYTFDFFMIFVVSNVILYLFIFPFVFFVLRYKVRKVKKQTESKSLRVGIFHPYCNAGGGGEKVLWVGIAAMQKRYPKADLYIYTGDIEATPQEIIDKVENQLNVKVNNNLKFVYLTKRKWVEPVEYPILTLLGQALGSIYLGFEAIFKLVPDVFIETTGFTFVLPLFKYLGGCKIGCYVHYPIITKDMIGRVASGELMYNNRSAISRSPGLTYAKLMYYRVFSRFYSLAGRSSDISLVNSTFTMEHLTELWNRPLHLVYPPCDVEHLKKIPRPARRPHKIRILSLAQFRPEKNHPLQLQSLYELREIVNDESFARITLVLCGSCRNADDRMRVNDLRDLSKHLSLENNVEFKVNLTYDELLEEFKEAYIGIHTMLDEHFGIGIVELMASGLITIAHRSGGPLLDIIETSEGSRLGFLATTADEYAYIIKFILRCSDGEICEIRERARASVDRFTSKKFEEEFSRAIEPLFK